MTPTTSSEITKKDADSYLRIDYQKFIGRKILFMVSLIGFIGLVSPHLARMVIGGDNRFLMQASALVGELLLLGADTIARTILSPVILPAGIMTSFIGVHFFIYLLMRKRRDIF